MHKKSNADCGSKKGVNLSNRDDPAPYVRKNGLLVLGTSGRWQALASALVCVHDDAEEVRVVARRILRRWIHMPPNLYTTPSTALRGQILDGAKNLPEGFEALAETVTFALREDAVR